ncbi:hypothetical protein ACVOMV_18205 [Mesorhizobium atlanticum]
MSPRDPFPLQSEPTPEGEQTLVPGVRPITTRDRLALLRTRRCVRAHRRSRSISASSMKPDAIN